MWGVVSSWDLRWYQQTDERTVRWKRGEAEQKGRHDGKFDLERDNERRWDQDFITQASNRVGCSGDQSDERLRNGNLQTGVV